MDFKVDRNKWVRGGKKKFGEPSLLNKQGNMCCLGFCMIQCGFVPADIRNQDLPKDAARKYEKKNAKQLTIPGDRLVWRDDYDKRIHDTELSLAAANVNDDSLISDVERELRLKDIFAEAGHSIEFYDGDE